MFFLLLFFHSPHQQIIGGPNIPVSGTTVPLTITSRGGGPNQQNTISQIVRTVSNSTNASAVLPIAKVMPQQTLDLPAPIQLTQHHMTQQNVFLHTRSTNQASSNNNNNNNSNSTITATTSYLPSSQAFFYDPITTSGTTVLSLSTASSTPSSSSSTLSSTSLSSGLTTTVSYAPTSSFAVVPTAGGTNVSTRQGEPIRFGISTTPSAATLNVFHAGMIPTTGHSISIPQQQQQQPQQIQAVPVRFNPQLLVDSTTGTTTTAAAAATVSQQTNQIITMHSGQPHQQMHINKLAPAVVATAASTTTSNASPPRPSILRKRDNEG